MNRPYSEATRRLVRETFEDKIGEFGPFAAGDHAGDDETGAALDAVLDALARAGLLLPEGVETRTEWRVTGEPGGGFPSYSFVWSLANHYAEPERDARRFVELVQRGGGWPDGPHLSRRTVVETPWDAVRLAEGDNKPSQDHVEEARHAD